MRSTVFVNMSGIEFNGVLEKINLTVLGELNDVSST